MAENKIRKIKSSAVPKPAPASAGPASAGIEYDVDRGLILNPDNVNPAVYPDVRATFQLFDDFFGDVLDSRWNFQEGADTTTSDAAISVAQNGMVRITTGDSATTTMAGNGAQFEGQANFKANQKNLVFEIRVKVDAITNLALFVGLTDQVAALEMPFTLGGSDALTSNASDAVGVLFDTAADTDNWWFVGVKGDTDATKQNSGYAPVVATYETFRIEVDANGDAVFFRNGVQVGNKMVGAVTNTVALNPVVAAFSRTTSPRNVDVDYILVRQSR